MRRFLVLCALVTLAVAGARAADDEGVVGESAEQGGGDADVQQQHEQQRGSEDVVEKVVGSGASEVVELGSSAVSDESVHEWADVVGRDLPVLVEFYLPSCGHCQGFAPEYERVAKAFHSEPVVVARIDANRWNSISDQYRVKSVPDIRYFPAGSTVDQQYIRARVATDIVGFLNEYAGTKVVFDYSFRQQHAAAADTVVVDEGTCPVLHGAAALVESQANADAGVADADALDAAEEAAAAAEDAVEDADEAADEAEENAEADEEDAFEEAVAEAESDADAHETEQEIEEEAELEGEEEMEAEAEEEEADI